MRLRPLPILLPALLALAVPAPARPACATAPARAPLAVNFLGVSTIVLRAGDKAIMIDGFFSRPDVLDMPGIRPKPARVHRGLDRAGISRDEGGTWTEGARLLALLVAQAHHDHSMDAGPVARETGAILVGSSSTAQVALGTAPELERLERIDTVEGGEERCFGPFRVRIILSPHAPGIFTPLLTGETTAPVRPPAWVFAFRDTRNFSFLVTYGERSILIHPSADFPDERPGDPDDRLGNPDVIFLSVGDLGRRKRSFVLDYWDRVVRRSGAALVVPIHWDNFFRQVDFEAASPGDRLGVMPLSRHARVMRRLCGRAGAVAIRQLDAFEETGLEDLLAGRARVGNPCSAR